MAAASLCWSIGGLCIKFIPWGAMSIVGLRSLFAVAVFAIYRRSFKITLSSGNILAALCVAATTNLFIFANKLTTAAAAVLLQFTAPIFIILIQIVAYQKKPRTSEVVAVALTLSGMFLFFADKLGSGALLGNFLAITSGLTFAGVFLCNNRSDVQADQALFLGFLINACIGAPFVVFGVNANTGAWIAVSFLGIVQVGLAYILFSVGIKKTTALLACLITAIEPVLNPIWVALATNERPGPFAISGGVVILLTIICFNLWAERHPPSA